MDRVTFWESLSKRRRETAINLFAQAMHEIGFDTAIKPSSNFLEKKTDLMPLTKLKRQGVAMCSPGKKRKQEPPLPKMNCFLPEEAAG